MTGLPPGLPRLYTAAEVADALRCSVWWVREQVRRGRVPYCDVAGGHRFSTEHYAAIVRLLEVWPEKSAQPAPLPEPAAVAAEAPIGRLRARVPRRLREASQRNEAA